MKIFTASQLRELDAYTIDNEPIASIDLMERAGTACTMWLSEYIQPEQRTAIVCGMGNNGGDGLVIARQLYEMQYSVDVFIVRNANKPSSDFTTNLDRLQPYALPVTLISQPDEVPDFSDYKFILDAIFGTGLSRPVEGISGMVIQSINLSKAETVSIDLPSGTFCTFNHTNNGPRVKSKQILSIETPKLAFMLPENRDYMVNWKLVHIRLNEGKKQSLETPYHFTERQDIANLVPKRHPFDHKRLFGHVMLVGGSSGKTGAMVMAAKACVRSGAGLTSVHIPKSTVNIMQTAAPEVMVSVNDGLNHLTSAPIQGNFVFGIGPGMGTHTDSLDFLSQLFSDHKDPLVLDADAINLVASSPSLLRTIPARSILTPHLKEFERLVGSWENDEEMMQKAFSFSTNHNVVLVLKGRFTMVYSPETEVHFNSTGNPGMAKGGSGDVLTGIITALLAQGLDSLDAARLGVYVHGLSGDLAARDKGFISLSPLDTIEYIPQAFKQLYG